MSWLEELKAGDLVVVSDRHGDEIKKVSKVTPKQIKVFVYTTGTGYESSYWKESGDLVGQDPFYYRHLKEATPERLQLIRDKNKFNRLSKWVKDSKFSLEELEYFKTYIDSKKEDC